VSDALLNLHSATHPDWLDRVLASFDEFLKDHASCEKKASGMALSIASHYPDRPALLNAMADLAVEELSHYREVVRLLTQRGVQPGPDRKDDYVNGLNRLIRQEPFYLLDRLLIAAIIERRGHERFGLIATALDPGPLQRFYQSITLSEGRHFELFLNLAIDAHREIDVQARLDALCASEADLLADQPLAPTLH
jgi:tRNA-(ms[2]io[6]A)-hydroxylase